MARYPNARWEPWFPYDPERFITPTAIILHTNASGGVESPGPSYDNGNMLSWHFQVGEHGTIYQHRDTITRAAANRDANDFAIAIETWDDGSPDVSVLWTPEQMDALISLIGWCCNTHNIPRARVTQWQGPGVGYHRMFPQWNRPVHSCPGDTRAAQFDDELLPRLTAPAPIPTPIPVPTPSLEDLPVTFILESKGAWYLVDTLSGFFAANPTPMKPDLPIMNAGDDPNNFKAACEAMCTQVRTRSA